VWITRQANLQHPLLGLFPQILVLGYGRRTATSLEHQLSHGECLTGLLKVGHRRLYFLSGQSRPVLVILDPGDRHIVFIFSSFFAAPSCRHPIGGPLGLLESVSTVSVNVVQEPSHCPIDWRLQCFVGRRVYRHRYLNTG